MSKQLTPGFMKIKALKEEIKQHLGADYPKFINKLMYADEIRKEGDVYELSGIMLEGEQVYSVIDVPATSIQRVYPEKVNLDILKNILKRETLIKNGLEKEAENLRERLRQEQQRNSETLSFYRGLLRSIGDINQKPKDYYEEMSLW